MNSVHSTFSKMHLLQTLVWYFGPKADMPHCNKVCAKSELIFIHSLLSMWEIIVHILHHSIIKTPSYLIFKCNLFINDSTYMSLFLKKISMLIYRSFHCQFGCVHWYEPLAEHLPYRGCSHLLWTESSTLHTLQTDLSRNCSHQLLRRLSHRGIFHSENFLQHLGLA